MSTRMPWLIVSLPAQRIEDFNTYADEIGEPVSFLLRMACRARLAEPSFTGVDYDPEDGPRVEKLKVHVPEELKRRIFAAADAQGVSTSLWVEGAMVRAIWLERMAQMSTTEAGREELARVLKRAEKIVATGVYEPMTFRAPL